MQAMTQAILDQIKYVQPYIKKIDYMDNDNTIFYFGEDYPAVALENFKRLYKEHPDYYWAPYYYIGDKKYNLNELRP